MRTTKVIVTCDICGSDATELGAGLELEVLASTLNAKRVRLDLCDTHVEELVTATIRFVEAGEVIANAVPFREPKRSSSSTRPARRDAAQVQAIRAWARGAGYNVAERGRIPKEVEEAYNARPRLGGAA
jgi:hypothetical protein